MTATPIAGAGAFARNRSLSLSAQEPSTHRFSWAGASREKLESLEIHRIETIWPSLKRAFIINGCKDLAFDKLGASPKGDKIREWAMNPDVKAVLATKVLSLRIRESFLNQLPDMLEIFKNVHLIVLSDNKHLGGNLAVLDRLPKLMSVELIGTRVKKSELSHHLQGVAFFGEKGEKCPNAHTVKYIKDNREEIVQEGELALLESETASMTVEEAQLEVGERKKAIAERKKALNAS